MTFCGRKEGQKYVRILGRQVREVCRWTEGRGTEEQRGGSAEWGCWSLEYPAAKQCRR
jgi:hypothetical protein